MVFRKSGRLGRNCAWTYNGEAVEVVNSFNYLGITLNYTGNFNKTQSVIASQGRKCVFNLLRKGTVRISTCLWVIL